MQAESLPKKTIFVIEHMESYLYEWCFYEYAQMKEYISQTPYQLWITNTKIIQQFGMKNAEGQAQLAQQIEQNNKYWNLLKNIFDSDPEKYRLISQSVITLQNQQKLVAPVCMLDMRAEKQLSPEEEWGCLVFGGILGDHPPRDRPAPVRQHFPQIRHLGSLQLATDTAVLVSELILDKKLKLQEIPMVKEPTIKGTNKDGEITKVQMEGFSYVSQQLDIKNGVLRQNLSKKQKKGVYMNEGVHRLLIEQDLNAEGIM